MGGCPPTHYYDEETDSCLLREPGECPQGTTKSMIGKCLPDIPGECPDGTEYYPTSGACPSGPPDPATCVGDKVFDAATGFCRTSSGSGLGAQRSAGETSLGDVAVVKTWDESSPELAEACAARDTDACDWLPDLVVDEGGGIRCLMLSADKTFRTSQGFCRPAAAGDGDTEHYFTIEFEEGKIASISRTSPDVIDPAEASAPPTEEVTACFGYVFYGDDDSDEDEDEEDDWSEPISGAMPDGSKCPGTLYIDAGTFFGTETCTTMETTVPICAAPTTSGGGSSNICTPITIQSDCAKMPSCGWRGTICVKCSSETDQGICGNMDGCYWDITDSKCKSLN